MSKGKFDLLYKSLNKEQREAVDTIEGPVMVIAGPGTGKTTILTARIAQILKKTDTPAHGILAITYTDAGVKAMREKLSGIIGNRAHEVYIHTFHSFASAMISEYPDHFLYLRDLKQMTDVDREVLIRAILEEPKFTKLRPLGRPDSYLSSILKTISDAKKEALTASMVSSHAFSKIKRLKKDESSISTRGASKGNFKAEILEKIEKLERTILFSKVFERYEEMKEVEKLRDYDDLIIGLLVALRNDELLLRLIQERFLYLLVDEHQDTNDSQNFIISLIAEFFETPNIFIVGDEKQAIYRFQGASVENFLLLKKRWPKIKVISLSINYRSHQDILDAGFAMIENNYEGNEYADLRVKLKAGGEIKKRPLEVISAENTEAMENILIENLKEIIKKEPEATVAIITRRNRELERVLALLESNGIPVSSERSFDIFHHPLGRVFFDMLEFIADPTRVDLLANTIVSGLWGFSFGESLQVIRDLRSGKVDNLEKKLPTLKEINRRLLKGGAVGSIIDIADSSGFTGLVARDPAFVFVWKGITALSESLWRESQVDNPLELIKLMLAYRKSSESKTIKVSVGAPDLQVKAMTAHGSKGLEFDFVFIPYANEESWVGRTHGRSFVLPKEESNEHEIADIRRLFYVSLTRARKHVSILYSLEESNGRALSPLRFISELHPDSISATSVKRIKTTLDLLETKKSRVSEGEIALVNEAKKVLLKSGLSVTALNHFLKCPNEFLYESVLKMPQASAILAEKGSAIHDGFYRVWMLKIKNLQKIEETILQSVAQYIDKSFLSISDKTRVKEELMKDIPIVAKELLEHFKSKGVIHPECSVENYFETSYSGQKINIRLHGKLDAVIDFEDRLNIFDYKSKKAMTAQAIKGTKENDGGYFRQLVFYKMLAGGNFRWRNKKISTSLVFVSPDDRKKCPIVTLPVGDGDIKTVENEIHSLVESVWSGRIGNSHCSDTSCQYCGYRKLLI